MESQNEQLTSAEMQQDSMFMHWKEQYERAIQASLGDDVELCEELCEELTMQPWGVPWLYQAKAHGLLACIEGREDVVEQALAAKELYRRIFLRHPDHPLSEKLYSNSHIFLREVQKDAGMTELSPLYQGQALKEQDAVSTPTDLQALDALALVHVSTSPKDQKNSDSKEKAEASGKAA